MSAPTRRKAKIVFGMTSANERPSVIEQMVDLLDGRPVMLHHDFGKQPSLRLERPNLHFVRDTYETGWGTWGLCEAVLSTIRYALEEFDFDYFQLVSPSCMPLRPVAELEDHLARSGFDGNMDLVEVGSDDELLVNYGWRMYAPRGSLRQRALARARAAYFGPDAGRVQRIGLSVLSDSRVEPNLRMRLTKQLAIGTVRTMIHWPSGHRPFSRDFKAYVGSLWFSANRELCEFIVRRASEPSIVDYFSRLLNCDELVFPTLVGNAGMRIGPSNHFINTFNDRGNPRTFKPSDLDGLLERRAFLARKFPGNPAAPVRAALIARRELFAAPLGSRPKMGEAGLKVVFATTLGHGEGGETILRLAETLEGRRLVVHDPDGRVTDRNKCPDNVEFTTAPMVGGFRPTRLNAGLLQLLKYCVECVEFDYLQLLPADAVPMKPIHEFEHFISGTSFDAHADVVRLKAPKLFARYASRVCAKPGSLYHSLLRGMERLNAWSAESPSRTVVFEIGLRLTSTAALLLPLAHRALRGFSPSVGSLWFGASLEVCQHLARFGTEHSWVDYATHIGDNGEVLFASLLTDGTFVVGRSNVAMPELASAQPSSAWFVCSSSPPVEATAPTVRVPGRLAEQQVTATARRSLEERA